MPRRIDSLQELNPNADFFNRIGQKRTVEASLQPHAFCSTLTINGSEDSEMKEWHTTGSLQDSHLRAISEGVIHHGQALSRDKGGYSEPLACVLMENGMLLGGVTGRTEFQRLFVNYLWIDTLWRGQGLAAEALRRLEAAAMDRGCVDALIETLDDDIAQWYERCGYRLIAHLPEYCGPWSRHTFLKSLVPADIG